MPKPGFFIHSDWGSTMFLARRLKAEGHPVLFYCKNEQCAQVGQGIVPKTTSPVPPKGFSFVIFDNIKHGPAGRELRRKGFKVLGGNPFDNTLEGDRPEGARIMREIGVRTPEAKEFRSVPLAVKFLEAQEGAWFVKAIGGDTAECSTHDSPDPEGMIRYLKWAGERLKHFQLSKRIEGTEISVNGWFDGQRFIHPFDFTLEEKKFLPGGLGPRTGCESNLIWLAQDSKLADITVAPLAGHLMREGYVGPVDLNSLIMADGKPTGLEWTARMGFDATQAWAMLVNPLGEQLAEFLSGSLDTWQGSPDLAVTVRVSVPPYPVDAPKEVARYVGLPVDKRWLTDEHLLPEDVMVSPDGPVMAGGLGIVGQVGAVGTNLERVRQDVLTRAKDVMVPSKQYNNDPLARAKKDLRQLSKLGLVAHKELISA